MKITTFLCICFLSAFFCFTATQYSYATIVYDLYASPQSISSSQLWPEISGNVLGNTTFSIQNNTATFEVNVYDNFFNAYYNGEAPTIGLFNFETATDIDLEDLRVEGGTPHLIRNPGVDHWDYEIRVQDWSTPLTPISSLKVSIDNLSDLINEDNFLEDNWLTEAAYGFATPIMVTLHFPESYYAIGLPTQFVLYSYAPDQNNSAGGQYPEPVPEPSSILLLGGGLVGLFWRVRKCRQG